MKSIATAFLLFCLVESGWAQMPRKRVVKDRPVEATFKAPRVILLPSIKNYDANTLNFAIMHGFGLVNSGVQELWGLDGAANIRFGLDYGISDRWSVGFGRTRQDKVYDFRTKYVILRQMNSGKIPVTLAYQAGMGINTLERAFLAPYSFIDKLSYAHSLMIARKFSEQVSVQLTPMATHFNRVQPGDPNSVFALGFGGRFKLNNRTALMLEYIPVIGDRPQGTEDNFSIGFYIETGGHVFQLFFSSSFGLTEQYAVARNTENFFSDGFRFGFQVHRIFWFRNSARP